jgi:hypothetical protein
MLHAGLDLSRKKLDVCLLSQAGEIVEEWRRRLTRTVCAAWHDGAARSRAPGQASASWRASGYTSSSIARCASTASTRRPPPRDARPAWKGACSRPIRSRALDAPLSGQGLHSEGAISVPAYGGFGRDDDLGCPTIS